MVDDSKGYEVDLLYEIETKPKTDKKKIFIIIIIILLFVCICLTINYITKIVISHKVYKQYEEQLIFIKHQEKLAEEAERKKQEKIPKLTEERKKKC